MSVAAQDVLVETRKGPAGRARPEAELLLCCARARLDEAQRQRVRALCAGALDWSYVLLLTGRHGLLPLLHAHLNAVCPEAVPPEHRERLRDHARRVAAFNVLLTRELQKLIALFAAHGVEAMPYKGPALAEALYGDAALRQFSDLDILVRRADVRRARDLLLAEGYAPLPPLTEGQQAVLLRTQCNLPFTRERKRLVVELHWAVAAPRFASPFAPDDLWARRERGALGETPVSLPATEDLLLALCVHGSKHLWERLAWIADVAELLRQRPELDWPRLLRQALATGSDRMMLVGLRLAADLLGADLPADIERAASADPVVAALAARTVRDLFTPALTPSGVRGYFRYQLRARRRLRDKVNYLRYVVAPTEEDLGRVALPAPLTFVYYLLRPVRLLATGGPSHFH
ncbi:MAG TPA: nucleotidyltransferase family protein [Pyrinomonadaceae bacterium]